MHSRLLLNLLFMSLLVGLTSCTTIQKPGDERINQAEDLFTAGEYTEAAKLFSGMANWSRPQQKNELLLRAAAALAKAGHLHQAREILKSIDVPDNNPRLMLFKQLTQAHLSLVERQPEQVLEKLTTRLPPNTDPRHQAEFHALRANAYAMLGNRLETARELVLREPFLSGHEVIKTNQHDIWEALATLTGRALQQLRTEPPPDVLSGWMQLVQIAKAYQLHPAKLKEHLATWRHTYPNHPVLDDILTGLQSRRQEDVDAPKHIALLLPFNSKFAKAAVALRDGFLAAYYTHNSEHNKSTVKIYDVGLENVSIQDIYQRAVDEGAEFVVGPLGKDSVNQLAKIDPLSIPTLALNYSQQEDDLPENLYQFGLSPEEEARQVAERTWLAGYVYAAALVPIGPWGERVLHAFTERWQQLGGQTVEHQTYNPVQNDFSVPIRMLLNIDDSQRRHRSIVRLLKRDIKFSLRRRQDIDFIFLAAYPRQARQIRPQLKFFHATDVPVYATSHVFTGNLNQERDRDMDGLMFGDMPWVLSETSAQRRLHTDIEPFISDAGNSLQRLYALGIDAYNIIAALNPLRSYPYERFDGETGSLSLDEKQRVHRQLTWVKFRSGRPTLLDENI